MNTTEPTLIEILEAAEAAGLVRDAKLALRGLNAETLDVRFDGEPDGIIIVRDQVATWAARPGELLEGLRKVAAMVATWTEEDGPDDGRDTAYQELCDLVHPVDGHPANRGYDVECNGCTFQGPVEDMEWLNGAPYCGACADEFEA